MLGPDSFADEIYQFIGNDTNSSQTLLENWQNYAPPYLMWQKLA
jgi:hypothetical protein